MTSSYSRSTCAAATHSARPCSRPRAARSSGSRPSSTARMRSSRSSARKVRVGSARSSSDGHGGRGVAPAACPASSSPRMTSCSGPLSSRGGGSPARAAASRRMPKPKDWWVRASGVVVVPPSRAVTASLRRPAASRVGARTRQPSGSTSPAATRSATTSTTTVEQPVPGAPSTRNNGPRCSTTARWLASRSGGSAACEAGRRRTSTARFDHVPPTPASPQYVGSPGSTSRTHASTPPCTSTASTPLLRSRSTTSAERLPDLQWT